MHENDEREYHVEEQDEDLVASPILSEHEQWFVTERGLVRKSGEGRIGGYNIPRDAVGRDMWIAHIAQKAWADPCDFAEALYTARRIFGIGALDRAVQVRVPVNCLREKSSRPELSWQELVHDSNLRRQDEGPTARLLVDPGSAAAVLAAFGRLQVEGVQDAVSYTCQTEKMDGPSEATRYVRYHSAELERAVRACLLTARPMLEALGKWRGYETEYDELFGLVEEAMERLVKEGYFEHIDPRGPYHLAVYETASVDANPSGYGISLSVLPERFHVELPANLPSLATSE